MAGADANALAEALALPPGTEDVLVAATDDGSLLVAAVAGDRTEFFALDAADGVPARALSSFPLTARAEPGALAAPRLSSPSLSFAAVAFEAGGQVRVAVVDPTRGAQAFDVPVSLAGEVALHPSVAVRGGSVVAAYYAVSPSGARACVVTLDGATGSEGGRACVGAAGVPFPAVLLDGDAAFLLLFGPAKSALYAIEGTALSARGEAPLGGYAASLSATGGRLEGVLSDASGTSRVSVPFDDLTRVTRVALPLSSPTVAVAAAVSHDGRLAAAGRSLDGAWVLREGGLSQYAVAPRGGAFAFAAATDAFGLARALVGEGPATSPVGTSFSAGDPYAVRVSVSGPTSVLPLDSATFRVTVSAVRLPVSLVGLGVAAPEGWSAQAPAFTAALAAGESAATDIRLLAPAGALPGPYEVRVSPAVLESSIQHTHVFGVAVEGAASPISISYAGAPLELDPGESAVVGVQVTNRGGTAAVSEVRAGLAEGGLIVSPAATTVTVAAGGTATVSFIVTAPSSALPQADVRLAFEVLPGDASGISLALEVPAAVSPIFRPELVVGSADLGAAPGGTVTLPAKVANHGNVAGFVTVTASTLGLPESAVLAPGRALLVPAYGVVDAGVSLNVPPDAVADQRYSVTVAAATDAGAPLDGGRTLFGRVAPIVAVSAAYRGGGQVLPGETTTGTLTLDNHGNRAVTFDLTLGGAADGFAVFAAGSPAGGLVVAPWSSLDVPVTVRAPRDAPPGPRELMVSVSSDAGAPLDVPVPVEVGEVHVFGIRVLTPQIHVRDPAVERVAVEVALSSGSNTPERVALDFGGVAPPLFEVLPDGSAAELPLGSLVEVAPFSTVTVRALVPVGLSPGVTSREVPVVAETLSALRATDLATVIRPLSDPRVVDLTILPPLRGGPLHTVFANLSNGGLTTATGISVRLVVDGALVAHEPLAPLSPGVTRLVSFSFVPRADEQVVSVVLVSDLPAFDADLSNNEASVAYATPGAAPAPPSAPFSGAQAVPVAAASFSLLALLGVALTEVGKSTFLSLLFLPLYVKLKPGEVLDQYLRGQIHGYIIANPGEHYNAIKEQLGVTNGALAYHLRVLEKSGYIRAARDGMYKRFYPVGVKIPKRRRLSTFQEAIVKAVRDQPALSQKDLAELLGVSNQVINYHVKQLEGAHIIRLERDGRASRIFLGPEAPPEEKPAAPAPAATP